MATATSASAAGGGLRSACIARATPNNAALKIAVSLLAEPMFCAACSMFLKKVSLVKGMPSSFPSWLEAIHAARPNLKPVKLPATR